MMDQAKMKKAQLSFEFILLFTVLLFFFVSISYVLLVSGALDNSATTKSMAENLVNEIKVRFITASLSESDFSSGMMIPQEINDIGIAVSFYKHPDNLVLINNSESNELIARAFLPVVDDVIDLSPGQITNISVVKDADNKIKIYIERE
jgi:hypothetical protein